MNINTKNITVGFEVEGLYKVDGSSDFEEVETFASLHDYKGDGSVYSDDYDYNPYELVTKPLKYLSKDFNQFFKDFKRMQDSGFLKLNRTCGLHFHFQLGNRYQVTSEMSGAIIRKWQAMVKTSYPRLWEARKDNQYCGAVGSDYRIRNSNRRYASLNTQQLYGGYGTLECRLYGYVGRGSGKIDLIEYKQFVIDTINFYRDILKSEDNRKNLLDFTVKTDNSRLDRVAISI